MDSMQIAFLNDLDSKGLRPFIESVTSNIALSSTNIAYMVDDDRNGFFIPKRPLAAGVLRYCKNQQIVLAAAMEFGYSIIPNRHRTTVSGPGVIVQSRRLHDLDAPPFIRPNTRQYEMFADYLGSYTPFIIGEYFPPTKKGEGMTFIDRFAHPELYLCTLDTSLTAYEVHPIKAQIYLSGEYQKFVAANASEKPKRKKPDVRGKIKKDLQSKKQERRRRSNE